jgi:hypothetical protein
VEFAFTAGELFVTRCTVLTAEAVPREYTFCVSFFTRLETDLTLTTANGVSLGIDLTALNALALV